MLQEVRKRTMTSTTIELPDDVLAQVQDLAQSTNRRVEEVLAEAVAQGLAYDRWFRAEVEEALRSTRAGDFASPEAVEAMWNRLTTPEAMAEDEEQA
jgi:predicted transcriptional regulator